MTILLHLVKRSILYSIFVLTSLSPAKKSKHFVGFGSYEIWSCDGLPAFYFENSRLN